MNPNINVMRVLHCPFNWTRYLEIKKLCSVIAENLIFSTNRKLISISWKVWTYSNFSTNWKWKWMNRIWHGRKNVVGKQKFELIWRIIIFTNQISSHVVKMANKKARLSENEKFIELWHEEGSLWKFLSDDYKIRQEKEKSVGRISEKLEMTSK